MKFFTYDLIADANGWTDLPLSQLKRAQTRYAAAAEAYFQQLDNLRMRVSNTAWHFFRTGYGTTGLHDGRLLSLCIGDGLTYSATGRKPFRLNRQRLSARLEFLNHEQIYVHSFECRGLTHTRVAFDRVTAYPTIGSFGDLYTYELTDDGPCRLSLGFLFADGHEINLCFTRLLYRRRRVDPQYDPAEIYR